MSRAERHRSTERTTRRPLSQPLNSIIEAAVLPPAPARRASLFDRGSQFLSDARDRMTGEAGARHSTMSSASEFTKKKTIQIDDLKEMGFTVEDLSSAVYEKICEEELPNFLEGVRLDQDGGLDRISEIWDVQKIFWFVFLHVSVIFNVAIIVETNWTVFQSVLVNMFVEEQQIINLLTLTAKQHGPLGLSADVISNVTLQGSKRSVDIMEENAGQSADIFKHIPDVAVRKRLLVVASMVATFEVVWITIYLCRALKQLWRFARCTDEYKAYMAILNVFQDTLPICSTFSAIKLMARVHPSLLYTEYITFVQESKYNSSYLGMVGVSACFVVSRSLYAATALCAFTIKMVAVGLKMINPHYGLFLCLANVTALMVQCMGCVLFEKLMQDRIFLFVFGGQDTDYRDDEKALRNVYRCRMAKQIWMTHWLAGERFKAIVLLSTIDHYDLQRLLIEHNEFNYSDYDLDDIEDDGFNDPVDGTPPPEKTAPSDSRVSWFHHLPDPALAPPLLARDLRRLDQVALRPPPVLDGRLRPKPTGSPRVRAIDNWHPNHNFELGQRVRARDWGQGNSWREGVVTRIMPLKVTLDGGNVPHQWDEVVAIDSPDFQRAVS